MKKLLFIIALFASFSLSAQVVYEIKQVRINEVKLNEGRKSFHCIITIYGGVKGDDLTTPFSDGMELDIDLSLGEEIPDFIDKKCIEYFNEKYNK